MIEAMQRIIEVTKADLKEKGNMNAEFMLMSLYNAPVLTLDQVCEVVGVVKETAYSQRSNGTFPIPMSGKPLRADVRDVAAYLDKIRKTAR